MHTGDEYRQLLRLAMADFEQEHPSVANFEHQKTPCQVFYLDKHRGVGDASSTSFLVQTYVDDHTVAVTAETAKDAFAKAIEWHIVGKLADVSIIDGTRSYSIVEFSSVMALVEIANTIETDVNPARASDI